MRIFEKRGIVMDRLSIEDGNVYAGHEQFRVTMNGIVDEPSPGVRVVWLEFVHEDRERMDAAYISVEPNCATPIELYSGEGGIAESVVKGSGMMLAVDPDGETGVYEMYENEAHPDLHITGAGWIRSFVAGEEGAHILRINAPAQRMRKDTVNIEPGDLYVGDRMIPYLFQGYYEALSGIEWEK